MVNWAAVATVFVLPVSFLWDLVAFWRLQLNFWWRLYLGAGQNNHEDKVRRVQKQVLSWKEDGGGRKMCSARPSWMSITPITLGYKDRLYRVRLDEMNDILKVDKERMEVTVEPGVTIGFLNRMLVKYGVTLPVVPELDVLTIGGLVAGGGLESTSHKWGMFHHTCTQYEVVVADGSCVTANNNNNTELFHAIPMSYGTLGFLTAVTMKIVPYQPYLRLTYHPCYSLRETMEVLEIETNKDSGNDSVEGIAFSRDTAVIMTGQFVGLDEVEESKVNRLGLWYKPWFYQHVKTVLYRGEMVEYVPTLHFHQRHNKGCFWLAHLYLPWADGLIARILTGWLLPLNNQILKFLKEKFEKSQVFQDAQEGRGVIQDFMIPINHLEKAVELTDTITGIYPLWMVPSRLYQPSLPLEILPKAGDVIFIDLGVYGFSQLPDWPGPDSTLRKFEKFTLEHQGYQGLYAETLLTLEEFCDMFPHALYKRVRESLQYCEEAFPNTYEKVSRVGRMQVSMDINTKKRS